MTEELTRCKDEESNYLEFADFNLTALPSGILKDLPHVDTLFLNGNKLAGLPPGQLTSLPNLRQLFVQQNCITCPGLPNDLPRLTSLETLDLRHNRLEGHLPDFFYGLPRLKQLLLSFNKICELSDDLQNLQVRTLYTYVMMK